MKKSVFIFLLGIVVTITVTAQKPDVALTDKIAFQERVSFIKKSAFTENSSYALSDLVYQRMEWEINPEILFIKGTVTSYFKSKSDKLNEIEFDLTDSLSVDSVTQHGKKLSFTRTNNKLTITLKNSLQNQQLDSVSVHYKGVPPQTGSGAFSLTMHNNIPNIWTLSEPYGAMEWWPCKQSLTDKIDSIDIIVVSPEKYRTASNGILVSETITDGKRKMHWKHRFPIATYLVAVSVTDYSVYSDYLEMNNGDTIEILNYVYPENLEDAQKNTPVTADVIALYNRLIGKYPFAAEKYGHAQFGWGGGMEHQTMSFMGQFRFGLIAHELAHQWFGDYITLGSWHDIWLNEGFATYLTGLSYENLLEGVWWPVWKRVNVERIVSEPGGSVYVTDTTDVGRIFSGRLSYSKGAYVLHMLRYIMGDEKFFDGLRTYFNDPAVANGFANTAQFVNHMETAGDTTLTEFFDCWLYGEGFPVYSATFSPAETNSTKVTLSQTTSVPSSVSFFKMPVPVRVYNSTKTDSADFKLVNTENNQEFIIKPGFKVARLIINPDYDIISKTAEIVSAPVVNSNADELLVYPNPFTGDISVKITGNERIISTKIFSANGKLILEFTNNNRNINLSQLPKGVYILEAFTQNNRYRKQIIKQ